MVTKQELIDRVVAAANDKEIAGMFETSISRFGLEFFMRHERGFRAIFPTLYETVADDIKRLGGMIYDWGDFILAYAAIEQKVVDGNDLASVENVFSLDLRYSYFPHVPHCHNWTLYEAGLKNGRFTVEDVIAFTDLRPKFFGFFLPLIIAHGDEGIWKGVSERIKGAGLTDTLRLKIFECMLCTNNPAALRYFLDEIERNRYDRFKALNEQAAEMGTEECRLPAAKVLPILRDAVQKEFDRYAAAGFRENFYFHTAVQRLYPDAFPDYARKVLRAGLPNAKFSLLYCLSAYELSSQFMGDVMAGGLDRDAFSFMTDKIDCKYMDREVLSAFFRCMLALYDGMEKVNYHYGKTEDIAFARDVSKERVVLVLADAACVLDQPEYFAGLDARYESFGENAQAHYLNRAGAKTKLDVRACAIRFLKTDKPWSSGFYDKHNILLTFDEAVAVSDYLKSKREGVKSRIIKAFLASPAKTKIMNYLLAADEEYKVSVGREMSALQGKVNEKALKDTSAVRYYRPQDDIIELPCPRNSIEALLDCPPRKFKKRSISLARLKEFFERLSRFTQGHKDHEYKSRRGEGLRTFGSFFGELSGSDYDYRLFRDYPLGETLKQCVGSWLTEEELVSLLLLEVFSPKEMHKFYGVAYKSLLGGGKWEKLFDFLCADEGDRSYLLLILSSLEYPIIHELLSREARVELIELFSRKPFLDAVKAEHTPRLSVFSFFCRRDFEAWEQKSADSELLMAGAYATAVCLWSGAGYAPPNQLVSALYERELVTPEFVKYLILTHYALINGFTNSRSASYVYRPDYPYPRFKAFMLALIDESLNAELARGSIATPYNGIIQRLDYFRGAAYYVRAIAAIRGLTVVRSPSVNSNEKNESISKILKCTVKADDDTYEGFVSLLQEYGIEREELVRASLFNPSFLDYAERYLKIPNFRLAAYYFIAHLNEAEPFYENWLYERRKESVKEYSNIDFCDFRDGAFDYKWYKEMVETVPAADLKMIYDNAKYVTVGGQHKRAQRFFDAMNGKISKEACVDRIRASRNKDFLLVYSLIPLKDAADLRERYVFLQSFLKESKQFGAQRQLSERQTADIALDNLARAAGYSDTNLFLFELEADDAHDIYKTYVVDDLEITPAICENSYKVSLTLCKKGKPLAALPAKYAKNEVVVQLKEEVKQLNAKFRRIAQSFEQVMCDRTEFSCERVIRMARERTIEFVLEHLIFLIGDTPAVYQSGVFYDLNGQPPEGGTARIAHPVELKKAGVLSQAMEYIVRNNIKQPFKQVMREIYLKSEEELSQDSVLRFKGFNVDLRKCVSALKGKGWGISEDIGLRKVYYKTGTVATLFRKFDELYLYDYENVNRELHSIFFLNRRTEEVIPLKEVDDITFSETLRDVDLMITISANAIYDYELAMSTVEIRKELLKSIVSVLGLKNVSFLKDNISIQGTYGTYLVNIRTGLVSKEGKGNLLLDTVYSTDKPLLLDFVDEDPMTADIISKAVVLSGDAAVKDPAILRELKD